MTNFQILGNTKGNDLFYLYLPVKESISGKSTGNRCASAENYQRKKLQSPYWYQGSNTFFKKTKQFTQLRRNYIWNIKILTADYHKETKYVKTFYSSLGDGSVKSYLWQSFSHDIY